ncbi:mitochondrial inner-membrane-bound regulator-domain-containing protein [Bipolaris maydis]|nr:mitochondrial inner-membrane-bound regulator-domain-containing protein [Bipolaris maydis]
MLAPRAPSAFVCLRCEAQIARRRLPAVPRRIPRATFSASARLHDDGAETNDAVSESNGPKLKITKVVEPLNRVRRRKGKIIKETTASLGGIKQLGDHADILVLRELGDVLAEKGNEELETVAPFDPVQVPDIFASLQLEGKAITPEEIYQQIGSLRPTQHGDPNEPHYVKQATFLKLKNLLMNGFTQQQLMTFYSVAKNIKRGQVNQGVIDSLKRDGDDPKRPVERSEWQPGTTSITQRLPGVDRHVKIMGWRKNVSKQLLVDRILRDQWNLVLLEEIEKPGELELFLKPWQMTLLTVGEHNVLDEIARIRKVKFQIYKHHEILRITADKSTAEYAANDVEEALQRTEVKRMNLKNYMCLLEPDMIPQDQQLDLTTLLKQKDRDVVSALTKTKAKRSLINLLPLRDSITRTSDMLNLGPAATSIYPAPVYVDESLLSYRNRNAPLGRLSVPLPRISGPESIEDTEESVEAPKSSKAMVQGLVERTAAMILRAASKEFPHLEELGSWVAEPRRKFYVKFGQSLVPLEHANPAKAEADTPEQFSQTHFVSTFPGLSTLFTSPDISVTTRLHVPTLHYHFRPDPEQEGFDPSQLFPTIQIKMGTDRHGAKAYFRRTSLRFWQHIHTVSLPNKAADLQFYQYGNLRMTNDHNDANLHKWVGAAAKSISSGGRIVAPPLSIDIPKWTIPGCSIEEKGMAQIKYHFSGVEFRQAVSGSLLGENIAFSANQSSKLNAKGGELMAYYDDHSDMQLRDEAAVKAFVKRCYDIADLITDASAQTSPVSRQVRPRYPESARKMRRSGILGEASNAANDVGEEMIKKGLQERIAEYPSAPEDKVIGEASSIKDDVSADNAAAVEVQQGEEDIKTTPSSDMPDAAEPEPEVSEGRPLDSSSKGI